jgi:hypothetical protein
LASNFNQSDFKDINNPSGADFFKIGDPSNTSRHGSLLDYVTQNPFEVALMAGAAVAAPQVIGALEGMGYSATQAAAIAGAGQGAVNTAIQGGDMTDVLKNAGLGGLTPALGNLLPGGIGNAYNADNLVGSFIRGGINDVVAQGVLTGEVDFMDALASGGINAGVDVIKDIWGDLTQTNSAQDMVNRGESLNGGPISAEDALRLQDTTDLYGLLGDEGLLAQFGLDVGYLPTDWAGDVTDFLAGYTDRQTIVSPDGTEYTFIDGGKGNQMVLNPDGTINRDIVPQDAIDRKDGWYINETTRTTPFSGILNPDDPRYDERFFDLTSERSQDSTMTGIFEENPMAASGGTVGTGTGEGGGAPAGDANTLPSTNETPITDTLFPQGGDGMGEDILAGDQDLFEGTLPTGDLNGSPLPPEYYEDEVGQTEAELPAGGGGGGGGDGLPGVFETEEAIADQGEPNLLDLFQMPEIRRLPPKEQWIAVQQLMGTQA